MCRTMRWFSSASSIIYMYMRTCTACMACAEDKIATQICRSCWELCIVFLSYHRHFSRPRRPTARKFAPLHFYIVYGKLVSHSNFLHLLFIPCNSLSSIAVCCHWLLAALLTTIAMSHVLIHNLVAFGIYFTHRRGRIQAQARATAAIRPPHVHILNISRVCGAHIACLFYLQLWFLFSLGFPAIVFIFFSLVCVRLLAASNLWNDKEDFSQRCSQTNRRSRDG